MIFYINLFIIAGYKRFCKLFLRDKRKGLVFLLEKNAVRLDRLSNILLKYILWGRLSFFQDIGFAKKRNEGDANDKATKFQL